MVAVIAKEFGVLPSEVARDMDEDPRRLSQSCVALLRYSEAKQAFDSAKSGDKLEAWRGSEAMAAVKRNTKALHVERIAKRRAQRGK